MSASVALRGDAHQELVREALRLWSPASVLISEVRADTPLAGLGIDAHAWVSFAFAVRAASNDEVVINDSIAGSLITVGDVQAYVRAQLNA